jgi:hypothetical protein
MKRASCEIELQLTRGRGPRSDEPVTIGIPLPSGFAKDPRSLTLFDFSKDFRPIQVRALDRWTDGSVRWALVDFQATCVAESSRYTLVATSTDARDRLTDAVEACVPRVSVSVSSANGEVVIDTGAARFTLSATRGFPFASVRTSRGDVIKTAGTSLAIEDDRGRMIFPEVTRIEIEEDGPLRSSVRIDARAGRRGGRPLLEIVARVQAFAGSPTARVSLTVRNPAAALHRGGYWDLGDPGSILMRDVSLVLTFAPSERPRTITCSSEAGHALERAAGPIELYQDSSGGRNWKSSNHVNRAGDVPLKFRGYRLRGGLIRDGERADPIVIVSWEGHSVGASVRHFWQKFPMALEAGDDALTIRLFPGQHADLHELQAGEQVTHTIDVAFGDDAVGPSLLEWCRSPLFATVSPEWYCASGAVPFLFSAAADPHASYGALAAEGLDPQKGFFAKREIIDEYGWRNFGDLYADHEAVRQAPHPPLISHYNNQYDAVAAFAVHFMRTGDRRWWELAHDLASHVCDIDRYHTARDKSAYNGGLFWHTFHYVDAGRSTHRSYPRLPGVWGGGPSAEHDYSTGLMLLYFMTGDPRFREGVLGLAHWVLAMDDGNLTVFRWLSRSDTGWATATAVPTYHGPGRGAAYSVTTLLNAFVLTGERHFLAAAEKFLRRCIHPADDIEARDLLNAELRWSYTVFLQSLGRYLALKAEREELDANYGYARASLLHYARWMADRERPYFDRSEQLEFATETWVAQELRKSEVFRFAAAHTVGDERARFAERAEFFFDYALKALAGMETRTFTRPLVLLLGNGYSRAWFTRVEPVYPEPRSPQEFGRPTEFTPQKVIARRRVTRLAMAALLGGLVTVLGVLGLRAL